MFSTSTHLEVTPFSSKADYERVVDYFLSADEPFLRAMGVDQNSYDLERIFSHYADDFTMSSLYIAQIAGVASGSLTGKSAVRAYWSAALEKMPNLRFEHVQTLVGADSVTIYYRGVRGMVPPPTAAPR